MLGQRPSRRVPIRLAAIAGEIDAPASSQQKWRANSNAWTVSQQAGAIMSRVYIFQLRGLWFK